MHGIYNIFWLSAIGHRSFWENRKIFTRSEVTLWNQVCYWLLLIKVSYLLLVCFWQEQWLSGVITGLGRSTLEKTTMKHSPVSFLKSEDFTTSIIFGVLNLQLYWNFNWMLGFLGYENLNKRKETRESAWRSPGWDECVAYTVPLIREMHCRVMVPNDFSPTQ